MDVQHIHLVTTAIVLLVPKVTIQEPWTQIAKYPEDLKIYSRFYFCDFDITVVAMNFEIEAK